MRTQRRVFEYQTTERYYGIPNKNKNHMLEAEPISDGQSVSRTLYN